MNPKNKSESLRFYGDGIPYLKNAVSRGRLIVIEGPDGSGRSTQVELIKNKLESEGHSVVTTGLKRSNFIGQGIESAKKNLTLGQKTLELFYAADFADRLEHLIIPSLEAGHIVLADRYIYTLIARNAVRGINRKWSRDLFGFAVVPDLVFCLEVEQKRLFHRIFQKYSGLDYYETGADMSMGKDLYESFIIYQNKIAQEFKKLEKTYSLTPIDGNRSIEEVNADLEKRIGEFLAAD